MLLSLLMIFQVTAVIPTGHIISKAGKEILEMINSVNIPSSTGPEYPLVAGFVRLAFHDCIGDGGCDGCIDIDKPINTGLIRFINMLDGLYSTQYIKNISRADFYALAAVVALEKATEKSMDKFHGRSQLKFGRKECSTTPDEDSKNKFPSAMGNVDETLSYFTREFGFNTRESVALLGAHTLGRARMETSGFEGRWVRTSTTGGVNPASVLDNEYYKEIIRPWVQVEIAFPFNRRTKVQWQGPNTTPNTVLSRSNPNQVPLLLNSDFCFLFNYTVINAVGHIDCKICPPRRFKPGCYRLSTTTPLVVEYARNNTLWLSDFTDVFMKMLSRNSTKMLESNNMSTKNSTMVLRNSTLTFTNRSFICQNNTMALSNSTKFFRNGTVILGKITFAFRNFTVIIRNDTIVFKTSTMIFSNGTMVSKNNIMVEGVLFSIT